MCLRVPCLVAAALVLGAGVAAAAPGLVVAVDTSRSLRPAELAAVVELATQALREVPGAPPTALLAFDDVPRWVTTAGAPAATVAALGTLVPQGRSTQLNDALFTAARSLDSGGAVVLLTDGRDESSATTIEDVARLCELRGVRVLAVGIGQRVEERSLRRLALLTGGEYLGHASAVEPQRLAAAARAALTAAATSAIGPRPVVEERASRPAAAPNGAPSATKAERGDRSGAVAPAAARSTPSEAGAAGGDTVASAGDTTTRWWLLALPLGLLAVAAPVAVWAARRPRSRTSWCRRCGSEIAAGAACAHCDEVALQQRLRDCNLVRLEDTAELRIDTRELEAAATKPWNPDAIERTRVLTDQNVLLIREPGEAQRSYLLRADGAFAIGRDPKANTVALRDLALSARHFMVVPEEGAFYVVDIDSTNGTYLNQRRVRCARLASGDVIRAGQVDVEYRTYLSGVG
jgi:hypothetical protein